MLQMIVNTTLIPLPSVVSAPVCVATFGESLSHRVSYVPMFLESCLHKLFDDVSMLRLTRPILISFFPGCFISVT